jgi:hypothetical protein
MKGTKQILRMPPADRFSYTLETANFDLKGTFGKLKEMVNKNKNKFVHIE